MKSKKVITLVLLIVTSMLLLPSFIPISSVSASGSGLPLDPSFIHLEWYAPPHLDPLYYLLAPQVGDLWMTIHPMEETGNKYNLTYWVDTDGGGEINASDQIILRSLADNSSKWYHVEHVTATIRVENTTASPFPVNFMYLEFNGTLADFLGVGNPLNTMWHMIYPKWSLWFNLTSWKDNTDSILSPSDMVDFTNPYLPGFNLIYWHVDSVKVDLIVSEVEEYPEDPDFIHLDLDPAAEGVRSPVLGDRWHEIYPTYSNKYNLTYWVDTDGGGEINASDQIALLNLNETGPAKWYHVEWVTATIKVENTTGTGWYLEFGGPIEKFQETDDDPVNTFWHRVEPGFSSWFTIVGWNDVDSSLNLTVGDVIRFLSKTKVAGNWTVLELKTNLIVSEEPSYPESPGFMHLDIVPPFPTEEYLEEPYVSSLWDEIYPTIGPGGIPVNTYHIFSHIDNNNNSKIDHSDYIKLENLTTGEKKWYQVECVTATIHISRLVPIPETLYLEFGTNTTLDKFFKIWNNPVSTWWHEVWSIFSNWYHLTGWIDTNPDGKLGYSDNIIFNETGPDPWHVDMIKTNLIVSPVKPPTYFWVSPKTNINQTVSTTFQVDIMVEDALESQAWEFTLNFDNTVLGVTSVVEGGWISGQGNYTFIYTDPSVANGTGVLSVGAALQPPYTSGAALDGKLATVTFHVEAVGTSPLDLTDTKLIDMSSVATEYPNQDGFFANTATLHDIAIVDVEVLDHQVQQGDLVPINVTIHNEGTFAQNVSVTVYVDLECHVWNATDPDKLARGDEIWNFSFPINNVDPSETIWTVINWDTTPWPGEQYTVWVEVNKTDGAEDDDTHDNIFVEGGVHVTSSHDLKVWDVTLLTPQVDAVADHKGDDPVTQAAEKAQRNAEITVTVLNEGKFTENFTVTVTLNRTSDGSVVVLGPKHVLNLTASHSIVVGFEWDPNNDPNTNGTYTVTASVTLTTPLVIEEEKNLEDNVLTASENLTVVIRDIAVLSVSVLTDHPEGFNPITRMNVTAKNVGTEFMKFAIIVFADPMNVSQVVPPYIKPSFPILDGDEIFCGFISTALAPNVTHSYTGMALPDGTPGWNRTGSPQLSTVLKGYDEPRYPAGSSIVFPYGPYLIVAIIKEDPRYPDKNYANDYATTSYTLSPVNHDIAITNVKRLRRFVFPGDNFEVNVTLQNQGLNSENVNITVYADPNATRWDGDEVFVGNYTVLSMSVGSTTTVTVTCNSTGLTLNTWYTIVANATILSPPDDDPNDNTRSDLTIKITTYDIIVTNMTSNLPQTYLDTAYPTWGSGVLQFYVGVLNNDTAPHTFDLALYYNITAGLEIGRTTVTLAAQEFQNITFSWDPTALPGYPDNRSLAWPYPTFTIIAKAEVVDSRPGNNELTNRTVTIKWPGDATGDGHINLSDLSLLATHWFGHIAPGKTYNPQVDFNMDAQINLSDLSTLASNWFKGPLDP